MFGTKPQTTQIERILCPFDISGDSAKGLRYASALARSFNAKLFVCFCTNHENDMVAAERAKELRTKAATLINSEGQGTIAWDGIVVNSETAADGINDAAADLGANLIVMCSRRRPLRAALLGSTTETVYRTAPCPVLVTHPDMNDYVESPAEHIALKRVLVAHDFSDYSEVALSQALSLAQEYKAELHVLHVLPTPQNSEPEIAWTSTSNDGAYHKTILRLQKSIPPEAYASCRIKAAESFGKPYREVLSYARDNEIDLICMGAHGSGFGMQALFGSNVDRVIRQSTCPMMVARPLRPTIGRALEGAGASALYKAAQR